MKFFHMKISTVEFFPNYGNSCYVMSCYNHVMHLIGILEKFDKFDESGSNRQTKTNQSKTIAINASIFYCMHEHYLTYVGRALVFLVIRQSLFRQNISAERICQTFPLSKFPHIWYFIAYKKL